MKFVLILATLILNVPLAHAEVFECELIQIVENEGDHFSEKFTMEDSFTQVHGAPEREFRFKNYRAVVTSDSKWMTLTWQQDDRLIGGAVNLVSEPVKHRVLIILDPLNPGERQLSLNCALTPGRFM